LRRAEIRRDEEEKAVSPVIATILMVAITVVLAGVLYVWANNLASEGTDTSVGTLNTYTTEDAADETGPGAEDTLVKMQLTGKDDLAWSFVKITVSVGDNVYTCSVVAGDDCQISQAAGDNDNVWEPGEYLFLSEGTNDICSEAECQLHISVTHNGRTVAGDGVSGQGGNVGSGSVDGSSNGSGNGSGDGSGDGTGGGGEADNPTFSDGALSSTSLEPGDSLTFEVRIQDASGVLGTPNLAFYTANGQSLTRPDLSKISGSATDGIWSATFTIPEGEVGGQWYVSPTAYDIYDNYGRGDNYYFTVSGGGESDSPTFSNGSLSSTSLDPGDSLTFEVQIQDASGVSGTPNLAFYTANGQSLPRPELSKISGSVTDGIWSATFTIPEGEVGGQWYISPTAYDIHNNYGRGDNYYFTVSGGGESDDPTFSNGSLSSTSLDPGDSLTFQVRIQDASGVSGTPNLAFYTANGQSLTRPDLSKISGNATDGIWSATFTIPEGEVGGQWYVSPTAYDIYDNYGRGDNYYFTVSG